jgi:prepilin peptidase CpaA
MVSIWVFLAIAVAVAAAASVFDLRSTKIPDWLSLGALVAAVFGHFVWGLVSGGWQDGLVELGWSVFGAMVCTALPLACWREGSFGGGDVKLLAAMGALCLPRLGMTIEFYALIVASVVGVARLAANKKLFRSVSNAIALSKNSLLPKSRRREIPSEALTPVRFAPAVLAGVIGCCLFASKQGDVVLAEAPAPMSMVAATVPPPRSNGLALGSSPTISPTATTPTVNAPAPSVPAPTKMAGRTAPRARPGHQRPAPSAQP